MSTPALTFFFGPGSSSMAPHIALHEIGVPFESRPISLGKRETRTPEFLAINPEGHVPTLLIDGRPLTEVAGILYYLAKRFPEAALLPPGDVEAEAHAVSWMSFIASTVHPSRGQGLDVARAVWDRVEARLAGRTWLLGSYSIADIHLFRLFWRFHNAAQLPPGELPNLCAHYERCMQRPAVKKTIEIESAIGYELRGFIEPRSPRA
jgi:glutathione S-transferase